jgi:hypothetical protein
MHPDPATPAPLSPATWRPLPDTRSHVIRAVEQQSSGRSRVSACGRSHARTRLTGRDPQLPHLLPHTAGRSVEIPANWDLLGATVAVSKTGMGGFVHRGFESLPLRCTGETAAFAGQSQVAGDCAADPPRVSRGQLRAAVEGLRSLSRSLSTAAPPETDVRVLGPALRLVAPVRERARLLCLSSSAALALIRSSSVIACHRVPRRCPVGAERRRPSPDFRSRPGSPPQPEVRSPRAGRLVPVVRECARPARAVLR